MARYVDGFLLVVPRKNLAAYAAISRKAGKVWKKHGALDYVETVIDDPQDAFGKPFAKLTKATPSEAVVFSWITYKSRKHRDQVNKKVMADPALQGPDKMPFDHKRMSWAGFKPIVEL